jgi:hypothetical protein
VPVEDMFVVNDSAQYSLEEEEELHLQSGLTGREGEAGGLEVAGEGEVREVCVCALIESMGVSELVDVCTSIESTGVSELLDVCTLIESTGMSEFLDVVYAASVVEKFTVFVFLALLHVVREVLTEGRQDRVLGRATFSHLDRQCQRG